MRGGRGGTEDSPPANWAIFRPGPGVTPGAGAGRSVRSAASGARAPSPFGMSLRARMRDVDRSISPFVTQTNKDILQPITQTGAI